MLTWLEPTRVLIAPMPLTKIKASSSGKWPIKDRRNARYLSVTSTLNAVLKNVMELLRKVPPPVCPQPIRAVLLSLLPVRLDVHDCIFNKLRGFERFAVAPETSDNLYAEW